MVQIHCTGCQACLVWAADGRRLRRTIPRLEGLHECAEPGVPLAVTGALVQLELEIAECLGE